MVVRVTFGTHLRALMGERGYSLRGLAREIPYDPGQLSRVANDKAAPSPELAHRIDELLGAHGSIVALLPTRLPADESAEVLELMRRAEASDLGPGSLDVLEAGVARLARDYPVQPAPILRDRCKVVTRQVLGLLDQRTTLAQHRELLVQAGWATALLGCVYFDVGDKAAAEAARRTALHLGQQAGHGEIQGWAWEMAAWFALSDDDPHGVITAARAGQQHAGVSSAGVQLVLQEAKGHARQGDRTGAMDALEAGRRMLDTLDRPTYPDHHFVFDPGKWDFYNATILTMAGADEPAAEHAAHVVRQCEADGTLRWPMRWSDARVNLGIIAGRRGDLDEAAHHGALALTPARRSGDLPRRVGDLAEQLLGRWPDAEPARELEERVHEVRRALPPPGA